MIRDGSVLEREIKRIIVKLHQEIFGKGPEQLWVKIEQNICTFSCIKTLTPIEKFLLTTEDGLKQVVKLRAEISKAAIFKLRQEIELLCEVKILSTTSEICIEADTVYGAILFLWE